MFSYIGICDFPSREQSLQSADLFEKLAALSLTYTFTRKLMIGVMMSHKSMTNQQTRWTAVWPKKEEVANIFVDHLYAFNTLHYADYDGVTQMQHLLRAADYGGEYLHALQLDMIWPDPSMVMNFRYRRPKTQLVLQLNTRALQQMGNDPLRVVDKLRQYRDCIDYVLLDKSAGKGLGMDAQALLPFARAIRQQLPCIGLAAAGGLGPDTMHLVQPLVKEFPDISIDAQGKLRPSGNAMDPIEWGLADYYLTQAIRLFA